MIIGIERIFATFLFGEFNGDVIDFTTTPFYYIPENMQIPVSRFEKYMYAGPPASSGSFRMGNLTQAGGGTGFLGRSPADECAIPT